MEASVRRKPAKRADSTAKSGSSPPSWGPFLMGFFAQLTRRSNVGVLSLVLLFVVGAVLLTRVRDEGGGYESPRDGVPSRARPSGRYSLTARCRVGRSPDEIGERGLFSLGKRNTGFHSGFFAPQEECHVSCEDTHGLKSFYVPLHLFRRRAVNHVPVSG